MDAFEKIIRAVVEGQIRSFLHDHPECAAGWTGKRLDGRTKETAVMNSLSKRISRDLVCARTRVRLVATLLAVTTDASHEAGSAFLTGQPVPAVESETAAGTSTGTLV